jgi:7-carboxy-7-deazaguanine synthase
MKINEIFYSIQGEGQFIGRPMAFIRVSGCNLRCSWCDTKYAYDSGLELSIEDIIKKIGKYPTNHVCLTGGEPLIQDESIKLIESLIKLGYTIYLETNGSIKLDNLIKNEFLKISMDIKCPSSGEEQKMNFDNLKFLGAGDQVKFIIVDDGDYNYARMIINKYLSNNDSEIIFTPCHNNLNRIENKFNLPILAEKVLNDGLKVRVLPQLHKIIWPEKERGV